MAAPLIKAEEDWTEAHRFVLGGCIARGYELADAGISQIPANVRCNPNVPYTRGNVRWLIVDALIFEACAAGELPGVSAEWRANRSGPSSLEIQSANTVVYVAHLQSPDSPPAASEIKLGTMDYNQGVFEFIQQDARTTAVQLLLVHSGKEFAALRAYYDPENRGRHYQIGSNIMTGRVQATGFETESVSLVEPTLVLPPTAGQFSIQRDATEAGAS